MKKLERKIVLGIILTLLLIGTVRAPLPKTLVTLTETPPTSMTSIEMSMNASAFDWRARTKHVYNNATYWARWGFFDPVAMSGYEDSLESETIAQFFLFNVLLYNLTGDSIVYNRAIELATIIDEEYQEDNENLNCYGGLWIDYNNISGAFMPTMKHLHLDMAIVGMSLFYNLTEDTKWKTSVDAMADCSFDFMYNETSHAWYSQWNNDTQSFSGTVSHIIMFYTAAMSAYCKYVEYNSTLEDRVNLHYSWQMENDNEYANYGQNYWLTKTEGHTYYMFGELFTYLAFDNSTYREIYLNETDWLMGIMDANPEGNNGSLPFDWVKSSTPTWNSPSTGLHRWAATIALYHFGIAYRWTGNSTISTYINYLMDYLKRTVYPNGYWHFTSGTGTPNQDDRTWSPASAMFVLATVQYALEEKPDYPLAVTSTTLVNNLDFFSSLDLLYFRAIDQWNEWNWFRYTQTHHQITFYTQSSPATIYQDGTTFSDWTYSNNILLLNFTFSETTEFDLYFQDVSDSPHMTTSNGTISSIEYSNEQMTFTVDNVGKKRWNLGSNLFYDNFSSYATGSNGTPTWIPDGSYWYVTSDDLYYWNQSGGSSETVVNGSDYDNFRVDIDIKTQKNGYYDVTFRIRRQDTQNFYTVSFYLREDPHLFRLQQRKKDVARTLDYVDYNQLCLPDPETWYHITLHAKDNYFTVSLNGTEYLEYWDTWENQFPSGNFSLRIWTPRNQRYDNINITEYNSENIQVTTTLINCTTYGEPISVCGATSWSYDDSTKILTSTAIHTGATTITISWVTEPVTATVDIDPDTLDLTGKSKWLTAHIELPEDYDVSDIVVSTVRLNGEIEAESHPTKIGDYDADGVSDLMVKFDRRDVIALLRAGEATLTITGKVNETPFKGTDTIRVINR